MPARWNKDKAKLNIKKHDGVSFEQAAQVFFDPFVQYREAWRNHEKREGALGCDFDFRLLLVVHLDIEDEFRAPLKIQSSPKCKARKKFRRAAYEVYVSKKFFPQRSSWDEMWIFRGALYSHHFGPQGRSSRKGKL